MNTNFVVVLAIRSWPGCESGQCAEEIPPCVCPLTVSLLSSCFGTHNTIQYFNELWSYAEFENRRQQSDFFSEAQRR